VDTTERLLPPASSEAKTRIKSSVKNPQQITPAEFQIIEILWSSKNRLSVGEVQAELSAERPLAYTTVMTVLDKLARKGSVERVKRGKAYFYRPKVSREEVLDRLIEDFARDYFQGNLDELKEFLDTDKPTVGRPSGLGRELRVELL